MAILSRLKNGLLTFKDGDWGVTSSASSRYSRQFHPLAGNGDNAIDRSYQSSRNCGGAL
ncbi:MAG: hypothetical protein V7739_14890 [Motiliproteus sp.]